MATFIRYIFTSINRRYNGEDKVRKNLTPKLSIVFLRYYMEGFPDGTYFLRHIFSSRVKAFDVFTQGAEAKYIYIYIYIYKNITGTPSALWSSGERGSTERRTKQDQAHIHAHTYTSASKKVSIFVK